MTEDPPVSRRNPLGTEPGAIAAGETEYLYGHDFEEGFVPQAYLPEGKIYYEPSENGLEKRVKERLDYWRSQFETNKDKPGKS